MGPPFAGEGRSDIAPVGFASPTGFCDSDVTGEGVIGSGSLNQYRSNGCSLAALRGCVRAGFSSGRTLNLTDGRIESYVRSHTSSSALWRRFSEVTIFVLFVIMLLMQ